MAKENQGPIGESVEGDDPLIGQVLDGRYRVLDKLGEGGMGEVYSAEHVHIEKRVALKLLRPEIITNQEAVARFHQEARSASSIGHENIIRIEDFGNISDGRIYLCMELLAGKPLNELLHEGGLDAGRVLDILIQTGHGLAAAHQKGVVHRDMKPENVFITYDASGRDIPKLLDFGIAKVSGADGENHLTRTGTIFGTPFYMAPEQALGQAVDHRADIYAMGVIMYEAFTGGLPFTGESFMGILTKHITAEPVLPSEKAAEVNRVLPAGIEAVILRCMVKEPDGRYQTMNELVAALVEVRRQNAGAGMSAYLPVQNTQFGTPPAAAATPQPHTSGATLLASGAPAPIAGSGSGPIFSGSPAAASYPNPASSFGDNDAEIFEKPNKRGLWIALAILLLGGAATAAFVLLPSKDGGERSETRRRDRRSVRNDARAGSLDQTGAGASGKTVDRTNSNNPAKAGLDSKSQKTGGQDSLPSKGSGGDKKNDDEIEGSEAKEEPKASADKVIPPKVKQVIVEVLISSKPNRADVYVNGDPTGDTTPTVIRIVDGESTDILLKRDKFEDLQFSVDGSERKVIERLTRLEKADKPRRKNRDRTKKTDRDPKPRSEPPADKAEPAVPFCDRPENRSKIRCLPEDDCRRPENSAKLHCQLE